MRINYSIFIMMISMLWSGACYSEPHSHITKKPLQQKWSFDGHLGTVDRQSAARGFQVYKEVCAACHGMKLLSYRQLESSKEGYPPRGIGFTADEVKAIAAEYKVEDTNDDGEKIERTALPSDHFIAPYPNEKAARAANNQAFPPDLSLIIKARQDGANYLYSLLTGYTEKKPEGFQLEDGMSYNPYFPMSKIAMPPPLSDNIVTYHDGTKATIEQMSKDIVHFLQFASEPEMEHRKAMGIKVLGYLFIFTIVFYLAKVRIWDRLK
jgi:ubiquinol-cytochrome c reductase cytochrome c1 subunit